MKEEIQLPMKRAVCRCGARLPRDPLVVQTIRERPPSVNH